MFGMHRWIDVHAPDPSAAAAYYAALLGWEVGEADARGYRVARLGGARVAGIGTAPPGAGMAAWTAYVQVEDVAGCAAVAVESGGAVLVPPVAGGPAEDAARVMAVLADPSGAALGVASGGAGVEASGVPGAYGMSALHSPDLAAAATFYGTVFGWTLVETGDPRLAEWRLAGRDRPVAVASPIAPGSGVPPHWAVNVLVADADATCAAAAALGGGVLMGPVDSPGFRSAVLADPQGGVLAVSAWS